MSISPPKGRWGWRRVSGARAMANCSPPPITPAFPEYVEARWPIPAAWSYEALRRFHAASSGLMVATRTLADELIARGFPPPMLWPRGVDQTMFRPVADLPPELKNLPRPFFLYCGRVAPEKNIEAFLALDLPGSKIVVGDGPSRAPAPATLSFCRLCRSQGPRRTGALLFRRRCFRLPQPHRHFRQCDGRGARLRRSRRGFSGSRPDRRDHRPARRRSGSRPARRLPRGAKAFARRLPASRPRYSWPESARIFIENVLHARAAALARLASA